MRKFVLFLIGLFLFAFIATVEASVQTSPVEPRPFCPPPDSFVNSELVPAEGVDFGTYTEFCSLGVPRLAIDACVGWIGLGPQGSTTLCDLAGVTGFQRRTLPEPCTIAVWSLIGLCWGGVSCWRRRRGLVQSRVGWGRSRTQRCMSRPPWPDHVRARILEIIEKGAPR